jgi:cytochrome c
MKKAILVITFFSFVFLSFTEKKNKETLKPIHQSSIEKGKKLFNTNTCNACHQEQVKIVGPSLKDIASKYKAEKGNIINFLRGKSKAIVETDPGQTAIMKASLSITKPMKLEDLKAISEYILSIK